jgi:V/A-type H+-transporting ATPase subunit I
MLLRPRPAHWFELLTSREAMTAALECLAATRSVQLESRADTSGFLPRRELDEALEQYEETARRFGSYWPAPEFTPAGEKGREPTRMVQQALAGLQAWMTDASPLIDGLERVSREQRSLLWLRDLLAHGPGTLPDLAQLGRAGPVLAGAVFRVEPDTVLATQPAAVLTHWAQVGNHRFLICVGPAEQIRAISEQLAELKAQRLPLPQWLPDDRRQAVVAVGDRLNLLDEELARLGASLAELQQRHGLARVLGDFVVLRWFAERVPDLSATENLAWITGWTSDATGEALRSSLGAAQVPNLIRISAAPQGSQTPMLLTNPGWARPFEIFPRLLGVPAADEVDPSTLVGIVAPLIFGYMFGDVGQGLVLVVSGLALRKRVPALAILVPGGLMSMLFGWLFGSVFASEALLPALWLHPLAEPITLLLVPLGFGAALIVVGLLFAALQQHWAGQAVQWWRSRAGILLAYLGLLLSVADSRGLALAAAGCVWFVFGGLQRGANGAGLLKQAGELVEQLLQVVVNTISFVRVGAFALAHAGLGAAVSGLAEAPESRVAFLFVMLVGNVLIIALEGLVASIQTTRLILFEFFIRFMRASGRGFVPLTGPDKTASEANKTRREP